jgi:O-antigen/teichoic acid export membrane protein
MGARIEAPPAASRGLASGVVGEPGPAARSLLRGAYSLAANTALTSALGFVFWVLAARLFSDVEVGRDTVLISAMLELSTICQLNLVNGIVRFLPGLGDVAPRILALAYLATGAVAIALGASFVLVAPRISSASSRPSSSGGCSRSRTPL